MSTSVVALDGEKITISRGEGPVARVLRLDPEEVAALRAHFRSERPDLAEGEKVLHPILHADGSGYIDFDGGEIDQTVVTLRVVEDGHGAVRVQMTLWGEVALEVEQ